MIRRVIIGGILAVALAGASTADAAWLADGSGQSSIPSAALPAGATPTVNAAGSAVTVSWSASSMSSAAVNYLIRRYDATTSGQQSIGSGCSSTQTTLSCVEAGLGAGNWKYTVTPVYATWSGAEGPASATVTTPPPPPTNVLATATCSSGISIAWNAASGATGYQVLRGSSATGPFTVVASPAGTSFVDAGLAPSTTYYYAVQSTFNGAASTPSDGSSATTYAVVVGNAGFEAGNVSSWTTSPASGAPAATAVTTSGAFSAHGGTYYALVSPGAANVYSHLSQSFTATAGQTVSGWAYFDGRDYSPYLDDGAVVIQQGGSDIATVFAAGIATLGTNGHTAWTYWTYTVPSSGTYSIDARVRNVGDSGQPSYLGIDDVVVQ